MPFWEDVLDNLWKVPHQEPRPPDNSLGQILLSHSSLQMTDHLEDTMTVPPEKPWAGITQLSHALIHSKSCELTYLISYATYFWDNFLTWQ